MPEVQLCANPNPHPDQRLEGGVASLGQTPALILGLTLSLTLNQGRRVELRVLVVVARLQPLLVGTIWCQFVPYFDAVAIYALCSDTC